MPFWIRALTSLADKQLVIHGVHIHSSLYALYTRSATEPGHAKLHELRSICKVDETKLRRHRRALLQVIAQLILKCMGIEF